jgi:hypothetical protein
MAGTE